MTRIAPKLSEDEQLRTRAGPRPWRSCPPREPKELINRGGEKLSPTEIDAVLLGNPAVAEAASFGVPDRIYGEEVQAAVVLRADITAAELQAYCRSRLSDFEIPKVIHFVKELPKDATGKVERPHLTALFSN